MERVFMLAPPVTHEMFLWNMTPKMAFCPEKHLIGKPNIRIPIRSIGTYCGYQ